MTADAPDLDAIPDTACEQLLAAWCRAADVPCHFPLTGDGALDVIQIGGQFDVTATDLAHLERLGRFVIPDRWSARDLLRLAGILEARRHWRPTPGIHDPKKTREMIALEQARRDGRLRDVVTGLTAAGVDLRAALLMVVMADNRTVRERVLATVVALLADRGIDY